MNRKVVAALATLLCVSFAILLHADSTKTETVLSLIHI